MKEVKIIRIKLRIHGFKFLMPSLFLIRGDWLRGLNSLNLEWISHWNWNLGFIYGDFEIIRKWNPWGKNFEKDCKILKKYS